MSASPVLLHYNGKYYIVRDSIPNIEPLPAENFAYGKISIEGTLYVIAKRDWIYHLKAAVCTLQRLDVPLRSVYDSNQTMKELIDSLVQSLAVENSGPGEEKEMPPPAARPTVRDEQQRSLKLQRTDSFTIGRK